MLARLVTEYFVARKDFYPATPNLPIMGTDDDNSIRATVNPGVCQFETTICATYDGEEVELEVCSGCECINELTERINSLDPFTCLSMPYEENDLYRKAGELLKHSTCPIPMAILKCVEAASGLALPRDVELRFE